MYMCIVVCNTCTICTCITICVCVLVLLICVPDMLKETPHLNKRLPCLDASGES